MGRVCDDVDGDGQCTDADLPLKGAMVLADSGPYAVTDAQGSYRFRALPPGEVVVRLGSEAIEGRTLVPGRRRWVLHLPAGGLRVLDVAVKRAEASQGEDMEVMVTGSADVAAGRGSTQLRGAFTAGGLLGAEAQAGLVSQTQTSQFYGAVGVEAVGPSSLQLPLHAGAERRLGAVTFGAHLRGVLYQDLKSTSAVSPANSARGALLVPTLSFSMAVGPLELQTAAEYWLDRSELSAPTSANGSSRVDHFRVGGAASTKVAGMLTLSAQATYIGAIFGGQGPGDRGLIDVEATLRPPGLPSSAFALRYAVEGGLGPRLQHTGALGVQLELVPHTARLLQGSLAFALTSPANDAPTQYYAVVRLSAQPWAVFHVDVDYRLQHLASADQATLVHYASLELAYQATDYARVGLYGGLKEVAATNPTSSNERQALARLRLFY